MEGQKCHTFGRFGISCFGKAGFCKTHPKNWESFPHIPSPTWTDLRFPYARGLWYHHPLRGPIWLTNYNFHPHGLYCITIHYHSCSIDIYRTVKDVKCHNFRGRLGISHLEKERFCKSQPKSCKSFLHIPSPTWADLRFPHARGLRYHQPLMGIYQIDKL